MKLQAYASVARAPFLLLPFTLIALGTAAAAYLGSFDAIRALLALVGLLGAHVAVNALNEASDYRTGIDLHTERTPFSGGSGTLPAGELSPSSALLLGAFGFVVGLLVGVWFLERIGVILLPILIVGAIASLGYTDFLARLYVGELFAGLGLGALPVIGSALVQTENYDAVAIAASVPAFFMTFNLLLLNEFPDEEADVTGGRRNLVRLLGRPGAARVYVLFALMVPASLIAATLTAHLPATALIALLPSLLLAPPLRWALTRPEEPVPVPALASNVIWNLTTNLVLAAALAIAFVLPAGR